jgi:hypothetical protein
MARGWLIAVLFLGLMAPTALADDNEVEAAQDVISAQIEAFRKDDGETAYSFASPEIHLLFPSVAIFMNMVKSGYAPVYHPRQYQFGKSRMLGGEIEQDVEITAGDGSDWVAQYSLKRMPDGSFKITGCRLKQREGVGA